MNGVFLAILAVIIVAVLSFLMPWVSKKIEEPFTASSCADPSVTTPVAISPRPNTWADHVELGKQKYNFLGLLQSEPTRRAFDTGLAPSTMGSIDDKPQDNGPSMLQKLNKNLQNAFETVFLDPQTKDASGAVTPNISLGPSSTPVLTNAPTYFADAMKPERAERRGRVGYVEERLPPRDQGLEDAKTCEVNNLFYERKIDGTVSERSTPISRGDMCAMLDTSATNPINNAFPGDPNKICGVCIKGAKPISSPADYNPGNKAYNGIGGMLITKGDKNRDIAAAGNNESNAIYKPSYGTCEEGYFFLPGPDQRDKCMKATKRLNCEEIQSAGGFERGKALDGTDVSASDCRACIDSSKVNYVYYDETNPAPKGVRLRIVVPTGTGRTFIKITHTPSGGSGSMDYGPYTFTSTKTIPVTITEINTDNILNNVGYFTINAAKPGDSIRIQALQEFPHRPRGEKEVFFVGFAGKFADAQKLADSLDCDLATANQLRDAQRDGMQVCEAGWASDGIYTVRTNAITNNNFSDDSLCKLYTDKGNVQSVVNLSPSSSTQDASGAWLYGVKPSAEFIKSQDVAANMKIDPKISNFYTYYKLTDDSGISPAEKNSKYFKKSATVPLPNYRGICVQMEQNTTTTPQNFTPINVGIENYITSIGTDAITGDLVNRLSKYSRNGRFNDSERIARPKPPQTGTNAFSTINQNQYWLWAPYSTTEQSPAFDVTFVVPGFFELPTYTEDVAKCRGVLYDSKSHLDMVMPDACDNGLTDTCIAYTFQKAGGDLTKGTLRPTNETNRKIIKYKDYDAANPTKVLQSERNVDEVKLFLENIKARMKGTDPALRNMTDAERIAAMNLASQQLIGRNAVGPCETVSDTLDDTIAIVAKSGPFDEKCLDFLYRNTTGDNNNALDDLREGTYGALGNFFSGLKWPDEYSMASANDLNAFPYRACQPTGSWAPIQNGVANTKAVGEINAAIDGLSGDDRLLSDIKKAIKVFNDLHDNANSNSVTAADQELAIERCYGIKKKTFVTNCNGIVGKLLKIMDFSGNDISGSTLNVKLNSETTALSTFDFAEKAVEKITVTRVVPGAATSYIVLLKDAKGVVAQKVLRDISSSPVTLEFLQEDVRPYISYNDILNITGTTTLRFESAFGRQYFLRSDGTISNEGADNNTKFDLVAPQQTLAGATNVYSLKSLTSAASPTYIAKGVALSPTTTNSSIQSSSTRTSNADWAIERAVNGAYAFVSIALANTPGYYLVAERQPNNTLVAKAKVIDKTNDFDAFSACWRLYPAGS